VRTIVWQGPEQMAVEERPEPDAPAPGDVVLTGTPEGVGYRRDPKVLLKDGDRVVTEVAGVGRLENHVVAE